MVSLELGISTDGGTVGQRDSGQQAQLADREGAGWYNSVVRMADDGFLLSGARVTNFPGVAGGTSPIAIGEIEKRTDSGEQVWSRTYTPPPLRDADEVIPDKVSQFYFALPDSGEGHLQVGGYFDGGPVSTQTWLVKTDAQGDSQWEQWDISAETDSFANEFRDGVVATGQDGYLLAGRAIGGSAVDDRTGEGWVVALDTDGTVRWNRMYNPRGERYDDWSDDPEHDEFYAVTETGSGTYLLAGEALGTDESSSAGWLVEITPDGDVQWDRTYSIGTDDLQFVDVIQTDGGYVAAAIRGETAPPIGWEDALAEEDKRGYLFGVDTDGTVQWRREIDVLCHTVRQTESGSLLVLGQRDDRAVAALVSSDGTQLERIVAERPGDTAFFDSATVGSEKILVGKRSTDGLFVTVGDDTNGDTQNTLTVTKEGVEDGRGAFFVASQAGVSRAETGEGVTTGTATLDWLGPQTGTDTHYVQGEPETLLIKGTVRVRWNGSVVDPDDISTSGTTVDPDSLSQTLRVESTGTGAGYFAVTTTDGIAPVDAEPETDGFTALDWVGPERGVDTFRFDGEITRFLSTEHVRVFVNDTEVDRNEVTLATR
ncbi:hypothetical protein [Salinibaculum salinum]|uniref:hypothetical protein n=1 Tax=Salinibaculum salinum TaxID=3131996 RepID=UPI0030EF2609